MPVYQLLGGKLRDAIPTKMMIGAFDVPRARSLAERFLNWGVPCLKVKVGLDLAGDLARVRAVRERGRPGRAAHDRRQLRLERDHRAAGPRTACGHSNLLVAEQPIAPGDIEAMASLRTVGGIPIMADESVFTLADAWNVLRPHAADVISIYPGKNGGIAASIEIAHVAQAAGIACHVGSNLELGIGSAAMLHLACAVGSHRQRNLSRRHPRPALPRGRPADRPLDLNPEGARVPEGPGLGVELDEEQLARFRVDR